MTTSIASNELTERPWWCDGEPSDALEAMDAIRMQADDHRFVPADAVYALMDALAAVLNLHQPVTRPSFAPVCKVCTDDGRGDARTRWPCPTYRAISRELGVKTSNENGESNDA
jgi:hypothetical protein